MVDVGVHAPVGHGLVAGQGGLSDLPLDDDEGETLGDQRSGRSMKGFPAADQPLAHLLGIALSGERMGGLYGRRQCPERLRELGGGHRLGELGVARLKPEVGQHAAQDDLRWAPSVR